jgi:aminoglycoside phosphotransferase
VTGATAPAPATLADLIDLVGGRVACLAMSEDRNAKVTVLLFPPGQDRPGYVAKVPTTPTAAGQVTREAAVLGDPALRALGPIGATIPRPVMTVEHLGRPVLVTSGLPGRNMFAEYHSWRHTARAATVRADFAAAGRWLSELHRHTARSGCDLASMLDGAAESIARRFGDDAATAADLDRLEGLRCRLSGHRLARVMQHGDFWPGNLLTSDGRVSGVIDWEHARPDGVPVRDLARFAISYSLYLDRHTRPGRRVAGHPGLRADRWGAGLEYAVGAPGWYPELVRGFVAGGLRRLGVPANRWRDVMLAELASIAAETDHPGFARSHLLLFRRLTGGPQGERPPGPAAGGSGGSPRGPATGGFGGRRPPRVSHRGVGGSSPRVSHRGFGESPPRVSTARGR